MKTFDHIPLKENERQAIIVLEEKMYEKYKGAEILLFGYEVCD